jgi:hypothetical protein
MMQPRCCPRRFEVGTLRRCGERGLIRQGTGRHVERQDEIVGDAVPPTVTQQLHLPFCSVFERERRRENGGRAMVARASRHVRSGSE